MTYYAHSPSPIGNLLMTSDGHALTALQPAEMLPANLDWVHQPDLHLFHQVRCWLDHYFLGLTPDPRDLPLSPSGTAFQQQVWNLLLEIPCGKTRTYGDIAREIAERTGKTAMSSQAIGRAVGRNPIGIIIPCHRVLGSRNALTGYAWGLERKRWLLLHEGHRL